MSVQKLIIEEVVQSREMKDAVKKAFAENIDGKHLVIGIHGGINGINIRAEQVGKNTVFIGGEITRRAKGKYVNKHVIVQTQFQHKEMMNSMGGDPVHARYNGDDSWRIDSDGINHFIRTALNEGFDVQMKPKTVVNLFDLYEDTNDESNANNSNTSNNVGGVTPDVAAGKCPACGKDCGEFKSLRGHIGGKIAGGDDTHEGLNIRLADYT